MNSHLKMAERGGFEPPKPFGLHAFEARAFDHSAISPKNLCLFYTITIRNK